MDHSKLKLRPVIDVHYNMDTGSLNSIQASRGTAFASMPSTVSAAPVFSNAA
jgi:hypothetical protein